MLLGQTPGLAPSISSLVVSPEPVNQVTGAGGKKVFFFFFFSVKISEKLYQIDIYTERKIKPLIAFKIILLVNF